VADVTKYPFSTCGKLFFKVEGEPRWGTAFVVGRRGLFTAAHNLLDELGPTTDVEFLLQYEDGRSAGTWVPDPGQVFIPPEWQPPKATATFDFAAFRTTVDLPVDRCGVLGFQPTLDLPQRLPAMALGYPYLAGGSEAMWECRSAGSWSIVLSMLGSNFTDGAGGGPWVASVAGQTRVVGATAQSFEEDALLTSPPFNDEVRQYFNLVSGP
jgi:hypothetical protein